jgi:uncharacterized membrane-anchored protein YitT (DUF2179 family)
LSIGIQTVLFTWLPVPAPILPDVLSNAIIGAFVAGIGIGLCLRGQGCAGGLDILGMVLAKKKPDFSVGKLSYIVNAFVLAISAFLFDLQVSLYSFVFIIITYYVSDKVHIQNINVWALIITRNPEVKSIIMSKTGRGVTFWNGYGAYTDRPEEILVTAINKYEVRTLKNLVKEADPEAFVILTEGDPIRGNFEKRLIS